MKLNSKIIPIAVIIIVALVWLYPDEPEVKNTRKEQLQEYFSVWDGSHIGLTKTIKSAMNDPNSYEHEKTIFWDRNTYLIVKTTFRGKNSFGGVVKIQ